MSKSEDTYCRLCAEPRPKEQLICKDDEVAVTSEIVTKMLWINIDVSSSNALPNTICLSCFHQLEKTFTFLHNVRNAQRKLSIIFSRISNYETFNCTIANKTGIAENVAKPVDEDWESFQVKKKQLKDNNKIEFTLKSSSIDDSNLFKCNINVKREIHNDDETSLGECNNFDTDDSSLIKSNINVKQELHNDDETSLGECNNFDTDDSNLIKSNIIVKQELHNGDEPSLGECNNVDTDDSNLIKSNINVKHELHNDDEPSLGECNNFDTDTCDLADKDLPLHTKVMNVEQTALLNCYTIKAENGTKLIDDWDWESFQVIKKGCEDEKQIETDPELSSVHDTNLFECNVNIVKQKIHSDDDTPLGSKMPKTNAEKCKDYYKRNQAEKRKKSAERVRAHRLRQKIILEQSGRSISGPSGIILNSDICAVTPGPSRQPALISLNEIISDNIVNLVGDNMCDSSLSTSAHDYRSVITVQPEVHMQNSPLLRILRCQKIKKVPLTAAERMRRMRAKKKTANN